MLVRLRLDIRGIGLVFYSPFAVAAIGEGENYLEPHYWQPADVARHVLAGTIAGFCTGSPGTYEVELADGAPGPADRLQYQWWIRLALEVRDRTMCIRDLYDLQNWSAALPEEQRIELDDGFYRVSVGTREPESGVIGDEQEILMMFERVDQLPDLVWDTVPFLGAGSI